MIFMSSNHVPGRIRHTKGNNSPRNIKNGLSSLKHSTKTLTVASSPDLAELGIM